MSNMKLVDNLFEFTWNDKAFQIREPSRRESISFESGMKNFKEDELEAQDKFMIEFLISLGLPSDIVDDIPNRHIVTIIESMAGKKK